VEFAAMQPVPPGTALSGWSISRAGADGKLGKAVRMNGTVKDLEKQAPERAKKK
jgi:hypothetical protein